MSLENMEQAAQREIDQCEKEKNALYAKLARVTKQRDNLRFKAEAIRHIIEDDYIERFPAAWKVFIDAIEQAKDSYSDRSE